MVDTGGTEAQSAKNILFPWSRSRTLEAAPPAKEGEDGEWVGALNCTSFAYSFPTDAFLLPKETGTQGESYSYHPLV